MQYCYNAIQTPAYVWARAQEPALLQMYGERGVNDGLADLNPCVCYRAEGYQAGYDAALAEGYMWIIASAYMGWVPVNGGVAQRQRQET